MHINIDTEIEVISAYVRTPTISLNYYKAFKLLYPNIPIVIVNNSNNPRSLKELNEFRDKFKDTQIVSPGSNLGHGLGVHYGITESPLKRPYIFVLDSDCKVTKPGLIELLVEATTEGFYGVGWCITLDEWGRNIYNPDDDSKNVKYLFPVVALISREEYFKFPQFNNTDIPLLTTMIALKAANYESKLIHIPNIWSYIEHWGGQMTNTGYVHPHWGEIRQDYEE